jgi:hypothetical protein
LNSFNHHSLLDVRLRQGIGPRPQAQPAMTVFRQTEFIFAFLNNMTWERLQVAVIFAIDYRCLTSASYRPLLTLASTRRSDQCNPSTREITASLSRFLDI